MAISSSGMTSLLPKPILSWLGSSIGKQVYICVRLSVGAP